jgi:DNA-nicking Smr family endonuclease
MKKRVQESDSELFRQAVDDAEPLELEAPVHYRERPPPIPRPRPPEIDEDAPRKLSEHEVETPDYLLYTQPGVQRRVLAELQRGRIAVDLELDLHGLTSAHAEAILREFLAHCRERHLRCARIIHGKGARSPGRQPVLKRKLNYWLRLRPEVLAFCSTPQRDGGTGALYLLLRNPAKSQRRRGRDR